jgi:LPS export ABC transporter protein LptC
MIDKGDVIINKPVEINIRDAKFTTDTLTWDSKNGLITTDDYIRFSGKKFRIEGKGLTAETKLHKVMILSDVKGIFYL